MPTTSTPTSSKRDRDPGDAVPDRSGGDQGDGRDDVDDRRERGERERDRGLVEPVDDLEDERPVAASARIP